MKVFREGKLVDSKIQTGNVLVVELYRKDAVELADPASNYTMDRFSSFPHQFHEGGFGWSADDKIHMYLKDGTLNPDGLVELSLDPGGDLAFTIWDAQPLRLSKGDDQFEAQSPFLKSDPSGKLARLGIEAVRIFGLDYLAYELDVNQARPISGNW